MTEINKLERTMPHDYRIDADKVRQRLEQTKRWFSTEQRRGDSVDISVEGRRALGEDVMEMTMQNTNEVVWEHYTAMRSADSITLRNGNYDAEDVRKSVMDSYETRYNEMIREHESGNRIVSYGLTGERSLTLDEDLAGLDEAYKMRLANLEGYLTCQQTNKAFANPDSAWFFHR